MTIRLKIQILLFAFATSIIACKKDLQVGNPNSPTLVNNVNNEAGIVSLAQGSVYINGFQNGTGWLGDSYFSLVYGYHDLLGDVVGADAANQLISQMSLPDYFILDNNTKVTNPSPTRTLLRTYNTRSQTANGYNPLYYQWLTMSSLNNACNVTLDQLSNVTFATGDAATKSNTIKAWCYFWKGYAYASIGSMYYSGLILDKSNSTSNEYKIKDSIISRSNYYYNLAATTLSGITNTADYTSIISQLIPKFCQVGNGGVLTTQMWIRNINTLLARNILVNKLSPFVNGSTTATITGASIPAMTSADWTSVLNYATNGIQKGDYVFTGRTTSVNGFFSTGGGSVAALTTGPNASTTFKISERLIQQYQSGDNRLANNFKQNVPYTNTLNFGSRWDLVSGGNGISGTITLGYKTQVGSYELFIAGSYEENALMLAEANIRLGNISAALPLIDAVRTAQGAGLSPLAGSSLTANQAMAQLVSERRVALLFRGLSFYDARRFGWTYDVTKGGGFYKAVVLQGTSSLNTNVFINYNFIDYWDVPADESDLNPPSATSAPIKNPNF